MHYLDMPSVEEVGNLNLVRSQASISIYLATTPISRETEHTRVTLSNLIKKAIKQLETAGIEKRRIQLLQQQFDDLFIDLINGRMKNKHLDSFMYKVTDLGGAIFSTLIAIAFIAFGTKDIKYLGIEFLIVLGISQVIVQGLKKVLSRERPYKILEHLHTFGIELRDYSFPSGHTTASFSLATTLAVNLPKLAVIVLFLALIIGMSRILY